MNNHAPPPPPRYVVQPVKAPRVRWRHRFYIFLLWLLSLVIVAAGMYVATDRGPLASPVQTAKRTLQSENLKLRQQVATLTRSAQVSRVATQSLKNTLASRESKIDKLRAKLGFYAHLVGGGTQHHGLRIEGVHLARVGDTRAWNFVATLTHNVKRGKDVDGRLQVAVEGILKGELVRLPWQKLSSRDASDGVRFSFRYFQQVHGTLMLPPGFTPNRLLVQANPEHGKSVTLRIGWADALKQVENKHHVQQQPTPTDS